ncbi:SURF1 family protein [Colletotrichum higginsianum IMI 349063]|uniref:SURF1-like protein n=2 Tax=Colletotrichum higginsianum TaxID=80884 RepID=A0A1B7Y1D6_COLHI|nr:SURF1 family protein [Colletotrichum higginsianum IMI 349063]OBR05825.1 SURF1 family protein [Colletotrichum higginsianum IMI 349063]TIC90379.1 Cytochrome oxidase assembly protein shy1 [Colletotrichum higginsianum]
MPPSLPRVFLRPSSLAARSCLRSIARPKTLARPGATVTPPTPSSSSSSRNITTRAFHTTRRTSASEPAPDFVSIVDNPPDLVRAGRRHGPGLIILALIPITAFVLGTWQVQRLGWKTDLIAKLEDRLVRDPLPLPPRIDPAAVADFDYRRVYATGRFRHDKEMLIGPRMWDGEQGYMVVTPLEREGDGTTVLVNRGWIGKDMADQRKRPASALPRGEVTVEGLLREPWKKNMFTPDNRPDRWEFFFPDVHQMAELTGSQPIWIEATMDHEFFRVIDLKSKGIPIGRAAEVNLRNNHAQYIFTWYGLAFATSIMLWMVVKKPPSDISKRVRMNKHW